jgi:hypothetical protein
MIELADLFAGIRAGASRRVAAIFDNDDRANYAVAQHVVGKQFAWLEEGIVRGM